MTGGEGVCSCAPIPQMHEPIAVRRRVGNQLETAEGLRDTYVSM